MTRSEKVTNVAVIVACGLIAVMLARNFYLSFKAPSVPQPVREVAKGETVKLPGDALTGRQPTLVMALSTHCHFCQDSVPFYQKLSAFKNSAPQGLRFVAMMPEKQEEAANYLKEHGIAADAVVSLPVSQIGVAGTPTLLLLNGESKLEEKWVGRLNAEEEAQMLARLKQACRLCSTPAGSPSLAPPGESGGGPSSQGR